MESRYRKDWPQRSVVLMQSSVRLTGSFFQPSAMTAMRNLTYVCGTELSCLRSLQLVADYA